MIYTKDSHCSFCGNYIAHLAWPRRCPSCKQISYQNPLPIAVVLQPIDHGLLLIQRGDSLTKSWALPGGHVEVGESWEEAAVRELAEETGLIVSADLITSYWTVSTPATKHILIFGLAPSLSAEALPPFTPSAEIIGRQLCYAPTTTAFPLHDEAIRRFFAPKQNNSDQPIEG